LGYELLFYQEVIHNSNSQEPNMLTKDFYTREDVVQLSQELLGKVIVTNINNQLTSGMIVETEAYKAPEDKACHAYLNKKTNRTKVMFEEGGVAYIYLCYGIHHLFNVVTGKEGMAHAILIRGVEPLEGIETMLERRKMRQVKKNMTAGPGSLSKALGFTKALTGHSLLNNQMMWIEDRGISLSRDQIIASPRVGIDYAGEYWKNMPWRFRIKNSKWTSR
jgi:DNA-3-methyladenine glycosylase